MCLKKSLKALFSRKKKHSKKKIHPVNISSFSESTTSSNSVSNNHCFNINPDQLMNFFNSPHLRHIVELIFFTLRIVFLLLDNNSIFKD